MEYLFIAILLLGMYHFLWEGILAPSFRYKLRFELFKCRDELRRLMINENNIPQWTYNHLQDVINTAIERMHRIDLLTLYDAGKEFKNNPHLRKQVDKEMGRLDKEIKQSGCQELIQLRSRVYFLFGVMFGVNIGGWAIYVVPIIFALVTFKRLKSLIKAFLYMPVGVLEKISPTQTVRHSL